MLGPTPLATGAFVAVDIETTGGRPGASDIIEIGAVRIEGGSFVDSFTSLVRPLERIPPAIRDLTGITDESVAQAPVIGDAMAAFKAFAEGAVLLAHNHRFDLGFLDYEAERWFGEPFPRPVLDTLSLARRLLPGLSHYNLRALSEAYECFAVPNHRALPDATATAEVFLAMLPALHERGIATAAEAAVFCGLARKGDLSRKLTLSTHLPEGPGLYLFRNAQGQVVYIGRAKDLRTRVRSHFYGSADSGDGHAEHTSSIDHIACASRLDSLLLESRLMDRYRPQYNRNRPELKMPLYVHVDPTSEYPVFRVTRRRYRSGVLLGPVSNEWAATTLTSAVAGHFRLRHCARHRDVCAARACSRRAAGLCVGALGAGPPLDYRRRVDAALGVFNGDAQRFRAELDRERERAVADERYEDAIRFRDAARALDRTLAALAASERATHEPVVVIIEGDQAGVAVHVVVQGWLHTTLRFTREAIATPRAEEVVARALTRARQRAARSLPVTPRRLRDMTIIDAYRQEHRPQSVTVGDDVNAAASGVASLMRRMTRVPRKRHADVASD